MNEPRQRPGVMLYFDTISPALARLSNEQRGALLMGIVEYAQTGALPELDSMTGMAFDMLRPSIDRDGDKYEDKRIHAQYMAYCRRQNERGEAKITEDEYRQKLLVTDSNVQQPPATGEYCTLPNPTVYPSPTTYPYPSTDPSTSPYPDGDGKGNPEGCKGEEKGSPEAIHAQFVDAMDAGDNAKALFCVNQLYRLGYVVDKATRQMARIQ